MPNYALVCPGCKRRFEAPAPVSMRYLIQSPCCSLAPCETDYQAQRIATDIPVYGSEARSMLDGFNPIEVPQARRIFGDTCRIGDDGSVSFDSVKQVAKYNRKMREVREGGTQGVAS